MTLEQITLRFAQNGPAKIAYSVHEPVGLGAQAPTLCLIASTGRGPNDFHHIAAPLMALGVRVILPWPRGSGESTAPLEGTDFYDLAEDVVAVLKAEAPQGPVYVAGHAYGCWIARTIAAIAPERISGVVLLAAAAGKWPSELSEAINTAMSPDVDTDIRLKALRLAFFAEDHDPTPWLDGWFPELAKLQRQARQLNKDENWQASGTAPILDVIGTRDPFRPPETYDHYADLLGPRVHIHTIDGVSHALPDEKPKEAADAIVDWINGLK